MRGKDISNQCFGLLIVIIKLHDKMKNQYCKNKNIPLYRIPYFELNKISQVEDIFNNKFLLNNSYKA